MTHGHAGGTGGLSPTCKFRQKLVKNPAVCNGTGSFGCFLDGGNNDKFYDSISGDRGAMLEYGSRFQLP